MAKRSVPATQETQLPAQSDNLLDLMRQHAGEGLDTIGVQDLLIPRLTILQGLSPQIAQGRPEFDPNARVGQIYDVGMKECFPSIRVVVAYYTRVWNEWMPRGAGNKGIIRRHTSNAILANTRPGENGVPTLPSGNVIVETAEFYVLNLMAGGRKSFIPMSSTQLKEAKRINNFIATEEVPDSDGKLFKPPIYYRTIDLSSVPTSNAKGTWQLWKVDRGPLLSEQPNAARLFAEVRSLREAIIGGHARGDMDEGEQAGLPWSDNGGQRRNDGPL